jgi:YVTN family beta-propeller protein
MKRAAALMALGVTIGSFASPAEAYKVFVSNEKGNSVSVLDSDMMEVVKTIKTGQRPRGIAISNDGKFIFVCASDDDTIQIIDTATFEIVGTLPSGPDPELIALSSDGKRLYVANEDDNLVTVIDVDSRTAVSRSWLASSRRGWGESGWQNGGRHVGNHQHGPFHRCGYARDHGHVLVDLTTTFRRVQERRLGGLGFRDRRHGERDRCQKSRGEEKIGFEIPGLAKAICCRRQHHQGWEEGIRRLDRPIASR